jgi:hypothetical protein
VTCSPLPTIDVLKDVPSCDSEATLGWRQPAEVGSCTRRAQEARFHLAASANLVSPWRGHWQKHEYARLTETAPEQTPCGIFVRPTQACGWTETYFLGGEERQPVPFPPSRRLLAFGQRWDKHSAERHAMRTRRT